MHKKLPAGPSRRLLFKLNEINFVSADICGGINPVYGVKVKIKVVIVYTYKLQIEECEGIFCK